MSKNKVGILATYPTVHTGLPSLPSTLSSVRMVRRRVRGGGGVGVSHRRRSPSVRVRVRSPSLPKGGEREGGREGGSGGKAFN